MTRLEELMEKVSFRRLDPGQIKHLKKSGILRKTFKPSKSAKRNLDGIMKRREEQQSLKNRELIRKLVQKGVLGK